MWIVLTKGHMTGHPSRSVHHGGDRDPSQEILTRSHSLSRTTPTRSISRRVRRVDDGFLFTGPNSGLHRSSIKAFVSLVLRIEAGCTRHGGVVLVSRFLVAGWTRPPVLGVNRRLVWVVGWYVVRMGVVRRVAWYWSLRWWWVRALYFQAVDVAWGSANRRGIE